jgi:D-alanyl-D-alanine dipeptidase
MKSALLSHPDYVHLGTISGLKFDLKYASTDNFMHKNVYGDFNQPLLHRLAAEKLRNAINSLKQEHPGHQLLIFDALRPRSVQRLLWAHVEGTPQQDYVAHPDRGSMHNYGCAVDLTVVDEKGIELDMGTLFDTFDPLSQPKLEEQFLLTGKLSAHQVENRLILRRAMTNAGFLQLPHEWWHYDAFEPSKVRSSFQIIE